MCLKCPLSQKKRFTVEALQWYLREAVSKSRLRRTLCYVCVQGTFCQWQSLDIRAMPLNSTVSLLRLSVEHANSTDEIRQNIKGKLIECVIGRLPLEKQLAARVTQWTYEEVLIKWTGYLCRRALQEWNSLEGRQEVVWEGRRCLERLTRPWVTHNHCPKWVVQLMESPSADEATPLKSQPRTTSRNKGTDTHIIDVDSSPYKLSLLLRVWRHTDIRPHMNNFLWC